MKSLRALRMKVACRLNILLMRVGVRIEPTGRRRPEPEFMRRFDETLGRLRADGRGFEVTEAICYDAGSHARSFIDYECEFASRHVAQHQPGRLLDIGSYRAFIVGLLAGRQVTTVDVRARQPASVNEEVFSCDAKALTFPAASFDMIVSLCSIEHFGLGRYGDDIDIDADAAAMDEMRRVLKPGGRLVLTTTLTRGRPHLAFNAHRVYDRAMIERLQEGFVIEDERAFSVAQGRECAVDEATDAPWRFDVYCGCWQKLER